MSNTKTVMSQAGNTQGIPPDITDVFSTYLYEGNGSTQTITNGIDLAGEGGLTWIKTRDYTYDHALYDTERGANNHLESNTNAAAVQYGSGGVNAFNSNGFSVQGGNDVNNGARKYASWTFRKAPKFFDIVTYTGDGTSNRQIAHNINGTVGTILIKRLDQGNWLAWHRSVNPGYGMLDLTLPFTAGANGFFNAVTDTYLETSWLNTSGVNFVAYVFAHNDGDGVFGPTGNQDIIKCGSYTGNGSATGPVIDLGFEPQWLMIKRATSSGTTNWLIWDAMRGLPVGGLDPYLAANQNWVEYTDNNYVDVSPTGFQIKHANQNVNTASQTYIYMAIRRGPLAPPTAATEVFAPNFYGTSGYVGYLGAPADMSMLGYRSGNSQNAVIRTRMLPNTKGLVTSSNAAEVTTSSSWDNMSGVSTASSTITTLISWTWKRAPSFFDVVAYTGTGSARNVSHNLGVAPELTLIKNRGTTSNWLALSYPTGLANSDGWSSDQAFSVSGGMPATWSSAATYFGVSANTNAGASGNNYIAYLFASLAGVSKVGSVTHSGTTNVDCGFSAGARFVLLKRTDATGDWYIWDSVRGIVSGNDPYLLLNSTAAQVTSTDYIDPLSSGFTITSTLTAGDYIFYAIA